MCDRVDHVDLEKVGRYGVRVVQRLLFRLQPPGRILRQVRRHGRSGWSRRQCHKSGRHSDTNRDRRRPNAGVVVVDEMTRSRTAQNSPHHAHTHLRQPPREYGARDRFIIRRRTSPLTGADAHFSSRSERCVSLAAEGKLTTVCASFSSFSRTISLNAN